MKAVVLVRNGSADKAFEVREVPVPQPKAGEVLVKVQAFGLNYADVMARQGLYDDAPPLPAILGYEVCGYVESVGSDVKGFKVGQRVAALTRFGGYAEYAVSDERAVVAISDSMDFGTATALATQYGTAWYCAEEMVRLYKGNNILIHAAAGGVGTALVQLAKKHGCTVFGTAGSDKKLEYLRQLGVDYPINYNTENFEEVVRAKLGTRGLDVIFDSIGGSYVKKGLKLLGSGGRIVCYGAAAMSGKKNIFRILKVALGFGFYSPIPFLQKSKGIIGVNMLRLADDRPEMLQHCLQSVAAAVEKGELSPITGAVYSYTQIAEAHEFLSGRQSVGKVVVTF